MKTTVRAAMILALLLGRAMAGDTNMETKDQRDERMAWWREARFGMFIHWGLYAVPAGTWNGKQVPGIGEWIMNTGKIPVADYSALAARFNPARYDARAWARLAKEAGMRYVVITSKHHDGFAMFASRASKYNIYDATPFKRDPLAELAEACREEGLRLGFYYSQAQDWHHPGGAAAGGHWDKAQDGSMDDYIRDVAVPQVREILTGYGPVAVLWWDTPVDMTKERAEKLAPLLSLQPGIISNDRLGGGFPGDTGTPEQEIPATGTPGRDWETCMTMNDTWGFKSCDHNWKSVEILVRNLCDIASKGGNYLLNVGPTAEGLIPEESVVRLKAVGAWLRANGAAIYGTSAGPFRRLPWGRCTRRENRLNLIVFDWPGDGKLVVPGLASRVKRAWLLTDPARTPLKTSIRSNGVMVEVPATAPDPVASVVVLEVAGEPKVENLLRAPASGPVEFRAVDAEIEGTTPRYESGGGKDNIGFWTDPKDTVKWAMEGVKPGRYRVSVTYACDKGAGGATYRVTAGRASVKGTIRETGSWTEFVTDELGSVSVGGRGRLTVRVVPGKMPGFAVMNLRSVTLTPGK
jgi:alpha-L-fucosidase